MDCEFREVCYHCEWHDNLYNSIDNLGCKCIFGEVCKSKKEIRKEKLIKLKKINYGFSNI
jgi:hypothetical protein